MAWSILSAPGTEDGPCEAACKHLDCQANRRLAAAVCRLCEKPIGYGVKFCNDPWRLSSEIHFSCMLAENDRRAGGGGLTTNVPPDDVPVETLGQVEHRVTMEACEAGLRKYLKDRQ